ncbi:hypothetical protein BMG_6203 (plasmid) [Priestia megaterium]|uniref:hypothetical protein n=1 Tax=Priestia megaterium TaxID=1404 RepID=UPI0015DCDF59|nr:hypothetical protein [Priestia megaterium]QLK09428.1 hypothetical protein BMG_6203 [Priestia megaterium]
MESKISLLELNKEINNNRSAFLTGNGFSINFDKEFSNLYDNLYSAHKILINNSQFNVKSNPVFKKVCKDNYKSVMQYLKYFSEADLLMIFEDAALFAESIISNKELIDELWKTNIITNLTFGFSQLEPLTQICEVSKVRGIKFVNIEHWTILIYFYAAIKKINPSCYELPIDNTFIMALKHGSKNKQNFIQGKNDTNELYSDVIFNGFTIYFRMLFSIAIFSKGKAVNFDKLDNKNNIDLNNLNEFLNGFDLLLSLNYDNIMEQIVLKKVEHLHGEFVMNKEEYVYHQSYGMNSEEGYVSFSDILIGDYFIFKSFLPVVNKLSAQRGFINKKIDTFGMKLDRLFIENSITTAVVFGMSIENDYHVLRNMMLAFYNSGVEEPHIIYSYFNEKEKKDFIEEFDKVITFSEEVNIYCRNIKVSYVQTQEILSNYFYKEIK